MKIDQIALAAPPMSSLRMMSPKIVKISMIHTKNKKNQRSDQSTWPVPNSAASSNCLTFLSVVSSEQPCSEPAPSCRSARLNINHSPCRRCTIASVIARPCHAHELENNMPLGPIEVLVINFPGNQFSGEIIPELERLVDNDTISIIDGILVRKDDNGDVTFTEFEEMGGNPEATALANVMNQLESLISDDDIMSFADTLEPNSSEAILVFEHTWAAPVARRHRQLRWSAREQLPRAPASSSTSCSPSSQRSTNPDPHHPRTHQPPRTHRQGEADMPRGRRGRPGLVGTMARTAVIAGTATAVVGHSQNKQAAKQQSAAEAQAAQQAALDSQTQVADMQAQLDAMQAQQAAPPPPSVAAPLRHRPTR